MAATTNRREPIPTTTIRETKDGRRIEYQMRVIQQPERARACGSGAKSSADRRPVDPPPVVELKIISVNGSEREDITFSYSANFFLFATLEVARPMAHGRVQQATASQQVPVLTGMPVSGMAYLDRPTEAGYFIFPDLSVRHEGMYKLSFNLYEEMRDRDGEAEQQPEKSRGMTGPGASDASFDWRMEVKSQEFTVFSAKKFPGLAESTALSRTVAEQGCRVRIRRDVRMRRREEKNGGDFEGAGEENQYERSRGAPQDYESQHAASSDDRAAYDAERRHYSEQYPRSSSVSPPSAYTPASQNGHLPFTGGSASQYQAPPQPQFAPPPHSAQPYQPPQSPYAPTSLYRSHAAPAPSTQTAYGYDRQYPQSAYPSNPPREQRECEPEYRRASYPTSQPIPHPSADANYSHPPYPAFNSRRPVSPDTRTLAPIQNLEAKFDARPLHPPLSAIKTINPPPLTSPRYNDEQHPYSQYPAPLAVADSSRDPTRNGKRPYDHVFSAVDTTKPLHNGMRPGSSQADANDEDDDEAAMQEQVKMSYKRADGSLQARKPPLLHD